MNFKDKVLESSGVREKDYSNHKEEEKKEETKEEKKVDGKDKK